ncbi:MAG: hypothetical protein GYA23_13195 [Methanomicrobiales archaeon]|nr:hypothetical protein [Methanomicrobiales archaeon]
MRKTIIIILAGIACAMLIAAGCTSSSTPSAATPAATATAATEPSATAVTTTAVTAATPVSEIPSWAGTWNTSYSVKDSSDAIVIMAMTQNGSLVTGTYNNGLGTIEATVQDRTITGTWNDSDNTGRYSGFFVFEKSADDKSFTGKWVSASESADALKTTTQYWNGVRV